MTMRLKRPLPRSEDLFGQIQAALAPDWRKLLICVDGANGVGKSSLASWLAWQLGAVAIHLDLYVIPDTRPLQWRTGDLQRAIDARLRIGPVILEGVLALNALEAVKRSPDFLIFAEGGSPSLRLGPLRHTTRSGARATERISRYRDLSTASGLAIPQESRHPLNSLGRFLSRITKRF